MSRKVAPNVAEKLKQLPKSPGCYIYRDEEGEVLYVGKAINLRNRVRSYFQASTQHGARIERMVFRVRDLEWIVVDSELEALVLECNLIKKHRPPYNVRLRDDKSYPYIVITNEKFPRVLFTRNPKKDKSKYFGPYTSAWAVRETIDLLHKVFPLIPCGKSWNGQPEQKPCLYHHIGQCMAPCAGLADLAEYRNVIGDVTACLSGRESTLLDSMKSAMARAAEDLDFERAASLRDRIQSMEKVLERQKVISEEGIDRDVIAVVRDDRGSAIQMLYVRNGKLIGQRQFILDGSKESSPGEAVQEFVKQYYADALEVPREVLLPVEIEERNIVQSWLRQRRNAAVTVDVPQGGEKLRLVDLAADNAEQALNIYRAELELKEEGSLRGVEELGEALGLPGPLLRIEGYDISNVQGTAPVSSMVVTENGEPAKNEYRKFAIKYHPESPNDFAMMHETLMRRFRRYRDGDPKFSRLPDLIMIDGGQGQLGAALRARDYFGLDVPMVGLAKKQELIIVPKQFGGGEAAEVDFDEALRRYANGENPRGYHYTFDSLELPLTSPGLIVLRRLRDEAHRFALTFHRKVRDKRMTGSVIEEIPGVGPRRRRMLLRTFGSIEGIRRASVDELAAVPTMTRAMAEKIRDFLNDE